MPFTVDDLVGKQQLRKANITDSLHDALNVMVEHDYSQLPVIAADGRLVGLVTSDSILRALDNNQATTASLSLTDAVIQIIDVDKETYRLNEDPFRLHERLKSTGAVIIVDEHHHPLRIITNADMAEWLRRLAQDNILAADVENKLKQYITYAFCDSSGQLDQSALDSAAATAADHVMRDARGKFRKGLLRYLSQADGKSPRIEETLLAEVLNQHYPINARAANFDSLTFSDYVGMFLDESRWQSYGDVLNRSRNDIGTLLDNVRRTRNDLAHLRKITARQRDQLRFCKGLFDRHEAALQRAFGTPMSQGSPNAKPIADETKQVPRVPKRLPKPRPTNPDSPRTIPDHWVIPTGGRPGTTAEEFLRNWLGHGFWGMGELTPGRKLLRTGDQVCFYAAKVGIVASAKIAGPADQLIPTDELPSPANGEAVYRVPLSNIRWITPSIVIDDSLRARLDAFKDKRPGAIWSWFIQTTRRITTHDFALLVGEKPIVD